MKIQLSINQISHTIDVSPGESLLKALRKLGYFGVKHGCETGECGACTVLLDSRSVNSCLYLAAQAEGHPIQTIESVGQHPEQGWKETPGLHPLQKAFVESGAIQCGYCTPAMILAALELLSRNPNPSEAEVRQVLSGILCRCTGYLKPVQAVLRAAAALRGEAIEPIEPGGWLLPNLGQGTAPEKPISYSPAPPDRELHPENTAAVATRLLPKVFVVPQTQPYQRVGKPEPKVDAVKLVQGKPA
jgi:putative selenate reductase molybdopterin-binding subunit